MARIIGRDLYFIHCPKNAGTAFLEAYCGNNQIGHVRLCHMPPHIKERSVGIVRNPFDRLVSIYEYNRMRRNYWHSFDGSTKFGPPPLYDFCTTHDFAEFIGHIKKHFGHIHLLEGWCDHCMPQAYWLAGVKYLLRFEHLDEDIAKLGFGDPGSPGSMKKVNCSHRRDWKEYYTPELEAIVRELYKDDFALISAIP